MKHHKSGLCKRCGYESCQKRREKHCTYSRHRVFHKDKYHVGNTGPTGSQGNTGQDGSTGLQGQDGPTGPQGNEGQDGSILNY